MVSINIGKKSLFSYLLIILALLSSTMAWGYVCFYAISSVMLIRTRFKKQSKQIRHYFWLFLLPNIVVFIHSLMTVAINHQSFYIPRSINNLLYIFFCIVFTYSIFALHKQYSINVLLSSVFTYYFILLVQAFVTVGPAIFIKNIFDIGSPVLTKWLEAHDIGLSLGLIIIYYLVFDRAKTRSRICFLFISIIVFILCDKRIAIGAILAVFAFRFFYHRKFDRRGKMILIWGTIGVVFCYAFVYLVRNEWILGWLWNRGINTMGRTYIYNQFRPYYSFSPLFFGRGSGFTAKMMALKAGTEFNIGNIMAIHSDILRIFIEYGFIGSGLWYAYYLIIMPKMMARKNERYSEVVFIIALYSFIIYLTDNTTNYLLFQTLYMLIPLCVWEIQDVGIQKM